MDSAATLQARALPMNARPCIRAFRGASPQTPSYPLWSAAATAWPVQPPARALPGASISKSRPLPHSTSQVTVLPPCPPEIPPHKAAHPEDPVRHHGDPHAHGSHAHPDAEDQAQPDAESNHGENRDRHGIFHIVTGPEHVGQHEGGRPEQDRQAVVDHHKDIGELRGLRPQAVKPQDRMQEQQDQAVCHRRGGICDQQQLFRIIPHLRQIPGSHALPYHGDHGQVHALPDDAAHAVQAVGHAVGGNLRRAEARDDAHHDHPPQLENAVLDAAGNPDIEDFVDYRTAFPVC